MKNTYIFSLIFSLLFIFTNCNDDLNISRTDRANSAGTSTQELILDKKGIGMSYKELTWSTRIGRLKPFWHYSWNRDLKNNIPDSDLKIFNNCCHNVHLEQPQKFNQVLRMNIFNIYCKIFARPVTSYLDYPKPLSCYIYIYT